MATILFVIAPRDFRDEELFEVQEVLQAAAIKTEIASIEPGEITGSRGGKVKVKKTILDINVADYGAIVFVGGKGAEVYFEDPIAMAICEETVRQNRILAAICIAPSILANAGVLKGKKATAFPSEKENLISRGAEYTGEPITVDGKIITASGPEAAKALGWTIAENLTK